ncbi:hypothetical protein RSOLAG1IB_06769 [Rhizoctonia solani AG-1 IB]|uniref:Jacalin-type lectin domain-containing protein n=1 Tax=Thanatephorus cucumeris (strain AG1-IB / isolate 7/3/14) TaxID=1108050 RepID=A0A0B7F976_THACB|nr:hypothetical protein RSOLAG1IB_06769 [Rhizoctonia solani AG-1 IB]
MQRQRVHDHGRAHDYSSPPSLTQATNQSRNNSAHLPDYAEDYMNIPPKVGPDEATRQALFFEEGYVFGVRTDGNDGPRPSSRRAAQMISTRPLCIQETSNIDSDVITTANYRATNYVHKGWSLSALSVSDKSPWTLSRIARNNQVNLGTRSITKYVLIQKLGVDLSPVDISPAPELEQAFQEALEKPTRFEKSEAVYQVFELWGDVIPLVFDIGISLAVTDLESEANYLRAPGRSYLGLHKLIMSGSARASTQGGDPASLQSEDNVKAWLRKPVPLDKWERVRVVKAVHLTSILNKQLQSRLTELHQSLTTYFPTATSTITSNGTSFDGTSHIFSTITKVAFYSDGNYIKALSVKYMNEDSPVTYGSGNKLNNEILLMAGEYVTDVLLWKDYNGICGIQLNTTKGITSQHFGSEGGTPTVMRSPGGCLSAFSGIIRSDIIYDLRTIWRHNVQGSGIGGEREFSKYYGGMGGTPFSDWHCVKQSNTARIKSIRVKCGTYIDGIEVTYEDSGPGGRGLTSRKGSYHGGSGGKEHVFLLGSDENIAAVLGRCNKYIVQLCFVTNKGRTSDIFGGGEGEDFRCQAPMTGEGKATRLHYICGKSGDWLNGVLLAWAPLGSAGVDEILM